MVVHEVCVAAALLWVLRTRGLDARRLAQRPSGADAVRGVGLAFAVWAAYTALWITSALLVPGSTQGLRGAYRVDGPLGFEIVLLVSVVNPIFEEGFVCGYVLSALTSKVGINAAVAVSVAIRLTYHLYQGPIALLSVIPMGAIHALWYAKAQRLAPIIISHAILDFVALVPYS